MGQHPTRQSNENAIMQFIREYRAVHGQSPTHREIAARLFFSRERVTQLVTDLVCRGALMRRHGKYRNLVIPPAPTLAECDDRESGH